MTKRFNCAIMSLSEVAKKKSLCEGVFFFFLRGRSFEMDRYLWGQEEAE